VHQDLMLVLHPSENKLSGLDTITIEQGKFQTLALLLSQGATVHDVTVSGKSRAFVFKDGQLLIPYKQ